ncbi:MAG: helix-turn-helix domain-containing protein [Clostridia bacterium]|nr:helix-turn-helix domain-containing protein [Clostridia bacterium]
MKMTNDEFRNLLIRAQAGDNEAMADILEMFMPLINKHSYVNDRLDGDLRQNIILKILKSIKNVAP